MLHRLLVLFVAALLALPGPAAARNAGQIHTGVVSTADPRATEAGREILRAGGSAADAAMAIMLALTVVEPQSSGIGGGGFLLYHDAVTGRLTTLNGRETAPASARPDQFLNTNGKPLSLDQAIPGGRSVGIPGNIALMAEAHRRYGRLPWSRLFAPAIRLAERGFIGTPRLEARTPLAPAILKDDPYARQVYYQPDGRVKRAGSRVRNPRLAAFLRTLARDGADAFYTGPHADRLIAAVADSPVNPARITHADLAGYRVREQGAVCGTYRVYRICGMGPPSSGGITVFTILKQVERFDLAAMGPRDPRAWHVIGESMRLAYADRARWIADPAFAAVPILGLMDDGYIAARSGAIRLDRAMGPVGFGQPPGTRVTIGAAGASDQGTTHFSVADRYGNVAAMTSTVESAFGSGLMVDGYMLNNELTDFAFVPASPDRPSPNQVEPGKRPMSSMAPTIVYDASGRVIAAVGAAGGTRIIAQTAKALIGLLDWGLPIDQAIALPQVLGMGDAIHLERGTYLETLAPALTAMGDTVVIDPFAASNQPGLKANGIAWTPAGWRGGADPRSEGTALTE